MEGRLLVPALADVEEERREGAGNAADEADRGQLEEMSTIRPPVVTGLRSCDDTVRSCTVVKKKASQRLRI